jgi:hypothetical protein
MSHTTDMALALDAKIGALIGAQVQAMPHDVYEIVSVAAGLASAVLREAGLRDENGQPVDPLDPDDREAFAAMQGKREMRGIGTIHMFGSRTSADVPTRSDS